MNVLDDVDLVTLLSVILPGTMTMSQESGSGAYCLLI